MGEWPTFEVAIRANEPGSLIHVALHRRKVNFPLRTYPASNRLMAELYAKRVYRAVNDLIGPAAGVEVRDGWVRSVPPPDLQKGTHGRR